MASPKIGKTLQIPPYTCKHPHTHTNARPPRPDRGTLGGEDGMYLTLQKNDPATRGCETEIVGYDAIFGEKTIEPGGGAKYCTVLL